MSENQITFRVVVPVADATGPGIRAVEVRATEYTVVDGVLHISGYEAALFADGKWLYMHGVADNKTEEN